MLVAVFLLSLSVATNSKLIAEKGKRVPPCLGERESWPRWPRETSDEVERDLSPLLHFSVFGFFLEDKTLPLAPRR